ncbi:MAG: hypothetical protein HOE90_16315 [Bacteriovoracaceae bacterium]|nr:hypothetical protein [Bacteriovoracaceae bacterium]
MSYRDTASFGKRQEYSVIAELLKRGFDVYMTLVDDQGIDCVVRLDNKRYLDIQIKARSKDAKQWNFFSMSFKPRKNLYFIFYTEKNDTFWTIPSARVKTLGRSNKTGNNIGRTSLNLPKLEAGEKTDKFEQFKNDDGFKLLNKFGK